MKNLYLLLALLSLTSAIIFSQSISKKQKIQEEIPVQTRPVGDISDQKNKQPVEREHPHGYPERNPREIVINPPREPDPPKRIEPLKEEPEVFVESDNKKWRCYSGGQFHFQHDKEATIDAAELLKIEGIENFEDGDYLKALMNFCNAIAESPGDFDLYFYRGCTNVKLANYLWAIEDLDLYISRSDGFPNNLFDEKLPEDKEAFYFRGLAKFYNKEKESAYIDLDSAAELGDKRAQIFLKRFY